jgi:hypothetical protein
MHPEGLLRVENLPKKQRELLIRSLNKIHSFDVCRVIDTVECQTQRIDNEKRNLLAQYNDLEFQKELLINQMKEG